MAWRKTDHVYPHPRLGEVLVRMRGLAMSDVEAALHHVPTGTRLEAEVPGGVCRKLSEEELCIVP